MTGLLLLPLPPLLQLKPLHLSSGHPEVCNWKKLDCLCLCCEWNFSTYVLFSMDSRTLVHLSEPLFYRTWLSFCFNFHFHTVRRRTARAEDRRPEIEELIVAALRREQQPPSPAPSEDELFLRSLVPALQRMPPHQKELVKFQIHKLVFESSTFTLNLEPVE